MRALLVLLSLSLCLPALAQDFVGARALGMSEAYRAIATGNDAIYLNPAGIARIRRYSPELHYRFDLDSEDHQFDISLVDSATTPVSVGLGYTFQGREFTKRTTLQHTGTLALAYPFLKDLLTVGVGAKYVNISDAIVGNYLSALSADVGALSVLPGGVHLAAVGYNLVPIRSTDVPLSAAFAVAWDLGPISAWLFGGHWALAPINDPSGTQVLPNFGEPLGPLSDMTLTFDWHIDFLPLAGPRNRYSTGFEWLAGETIPIRLGYSYSEGRPGLIASKEDHSVSIGGGIILPLMGIDLALQQSISSPNTRVFAASIKVFLNP